jgi:hypothetical protein
MDMAKKSLLVYDLKNKKPQEKTEITRKLFGFEDKSNNGSYVYKRDGLLKGIKHEKWNKAAILIDTKDEAKVVRILRKFGLRILITRVSK